MRNREVTEIFQLKFGIVIVVSILLFTASEAIGAQGSTSDYITDLIHKLDDPDFSVRSSAAYSLGGIGAEARAAVPALIETLKDSDWGVRGSVAYALGEIGTDAKAAVPSLIDALNDTDWGVRGSAADALGRIGTDARVAVPMLVATLNDTKPEVRSSAAEALGRIGLNAKFAVPTLIVVLKDLDWEVRASAATALGGIGIDAKTAVPALLRALDDVNTSVRRSAANALEGIGPAAEAAVLDLADALEDDDWGVRRSAANALAGIGSSASAAVPALIDSLADFDTGVRSSAANALERIGPAAKNAVPALIVALKDPEWGVRRSAANALLGIGPAAKAAVFALTDALKDSDMGVRGYAASALGRIGSDAKVAVPALVDALSDADTSVRASATDALSKIGSDAKAAVPVLMEALQSGNLDARISAASVLGKIGADAQAAVPALINALKDTDTAVRLSAASALGDIATSLSDAQLVATLDRLRLMYQSLRQYPEIRDSEPVHSVRQAIRNLEKIQPTPKQVALLWIADHPALRLGLLAYSVWVFIWINLYLFKPSSLLWINRILRPCEINLIGGNRLPLRRILFVGWLNYNSVVLDAWVNKHLDTARRHFSDKSTAEYTQIYIGVPINVNGKVLPACSAKVLRSLFNRRVGHLLISGESGSGKTSLACRIARWGMAEDPKEQIAKHPLIPVLIEEDLDLNQLEGHDALLEAIGRELRLLLGLDKGIDPELLHKLLVRRRLLVIIDRFSEMTEATRARIKPGAPNFPANALIVTSRHEEVLRGNRFVISTLRFGGNRLSLFLEEYLTQLGKRDLFDNVEFFNVCWQLSQTVGERGITPLLANAYIARVLASKEQMVEAPVGTTSES